MYKKELELHIKQNTLPKSVLLYGACNYQITSYADKLAKIFTAGVDEPLTFYFDAYDFASAKAHISQSSLFGDKNILIIKTSKAIPKKELDILVAICEKDSNSFMIVECFSEDKAKNMTKSFGKKKKADFVRFFKPHMGEAVQMMMEKAKEMDLNIQPFALQHLFLVHNEELSLAISEFPKLSTLGREVLKEDIDKLVYGLGTVAMDDFISNLILTKDVEKEFQNIIESGSYDEIRIINAIQNYITQLFSFYAYIRIHGSPDVKAILGYPLPPKLASQRIEQSRRIDRGQYQKILATLANAELSLKTKSNYDKETYLLYTILKIQQILKNREF